MRQCEIVAVVKDRKDRAKTALTQAYHFVQRADLFAGLIRSYTPRAEGDEALPTERKNPQASVGSILDRSKPTVIDLLDTVLTQDIGNCTAKADVIATDGTDTVNLVGVPATHLLFLEKQIVDLLTLAKALPVLDPAEQWTWDTSSGLYKSDPKQTVRTKKTQKPIVLYPATPEHPAQTQLITEDVPAGDWSAVMFSGAITVEKRDKIVRRLNLLHEAVAQAREQANAVTIQPQREGDAIWDFIFGP